MPKGSPTITFVGGLTLTGFVAPMLLDGPMNGECFLAWVEQMLAPTLQPGDIVIMDNLSAHKVAGIRDAIEAQDAKLLYLPPYSPDFNPIENAFAKLKAHVRKAAARTFDALETAAAKALAQFKADECLNFFAHAVHNCNVLRREIPMTTPSIDRRKAADPPYSTSSTCFGPVPNAFCASAA